MIECSKYNVDHVLSHNDLTCIYFMVGFFLFDLKLWGKLPSEDRFNEIVRFAEIKMNGWVGQQFKIGGRYISGQQNLSLHVHRQLLLQQSDIKMAPSWILRNNVTG